MSNPAKYKKIYDSRESDEHYTAFYQRITNCYFAGDYALAGGTVIRDKEKVGDVLCDRESRTLRTGIVSEIISRPGFYPDPAIVRFCFYAPSS